MTLFETVAVAVTVAVAAALLKDGAPRFLPPLFIAGGILILLPAVLKIATPLASLTELFQNSAVSEYLPPLFRAIGIGYTVGIAADVCRDLGAESVAGKLEVAGRIEIFAVTLPYLAELVRLAVQITGEGL